MSDAAQRGPGAPGHPTCSPRAPDLRPLSLPHAGPGQAVGVDAERLALSSPPHEGLSGTILQAGRASQPARPHPAKVAPNRAAQGQKRTCLCPFLGCLSSLEKAGAQAPGFWKLKL